MTEWWTYRPSDFLLFSPRTYYRLIELYNADAWPAQPLLVVLGLALWWAMCQRRHGAARAGCAVFGAAWLWVAWAFHAQRFATINWAAIGFAWAFALQGLLLCAHAGRKHEPASHLPAGPRHVAGLGLLLFALVAQPAVGPLFGRPWNQMEVTGLLPDPTVVGTLGLLLWLPRRRGPVPSWLLWPIPLAWCVLEGVALATMHAGDAALLPAAAAVALLAAALERRRRGPA